MASSPRRARPSSSRRRARAASPGASVARTIGQAVRTQRKLLGLTQATLARHAGVGLAFLYELETADLSRLMQKRLAELAR